MNPVHVVGAGGIGCALGYSLRAAGERVIFVDADPAKVAWGRAHGVQVGGWPALSADFVPFQDWQPPAGAVILLCTKCYDNAAVLARLPPSATLVPVQNGFDPQLTAQGHDLEGIASFVSECCPQQTRTRITRRGKLHLGQRGPATNAASSLLAHLALRLMGGVGYRLVVVPDIEPYKYTKLMYNAAIGPVAAAGGLDNGQLLSHRTARCLFFELLQENYAILHGDGVPLGKVGPFHPDTVARILQRRRLSTALAWAFYPSLRGSYCSMSRDLPAGRTEVDYYNGYLIERARERPCPWNRRAYALLKRMERERLPPGPDRLHELLGAAVNGTQLW